jgi:hypothetical protein
MVVAKVTSMPLTLWAVDRNINLLPRKNLKTNSLCGFPRARNPRVNPYHRLILSNPQHTLLLLNRIPSVTTTTLTLM